MIRVLAFDFLRHRIRIAIGIGMTLSFVQAAFSQPRAGKERPVLPMPLEFMAGNHEFTFQTQINKYFTPRSHFNFLSITSAASPYQNDVMQFDFINTSQVSYSLNNGPGLSVGINMNAKTGFSPTAGLQYVFSSKVLLLVIAPALLLTNDHNAQVVSVLEYKPLLGGNWRLYAKAQAFYNYNTGHRFQQRSYFYGRMGLMYGLIAAGVGSNLDWYGGPGLVRKDNFGLFIRYSFY